MVELEQGFGGMSPEAEAVCGSWEVVARDSWSLREQYVFEGAKCSCALDKGGSRVSSAESLAEDSHRAGEEENSRTGSYW